MREPDDRLAGLESYQALSLPLRRAVRLHLVHGVPPMEAMRLSGRERNAKRDWSQTAVQTVLKEYTDQPEDWQARLEALKLDPGPPAVLIPQKPLETAPELRQDAPGTTAELPKQPEYPPKRPEPAQDRVPVSTDVSVDQLFEGVRWAVNKAGQSSLDIWREQAQAEAEERERLIRIVEMEQAKNHW